MTDLSLIERYMGFYHKFFASSLDPSYSYVLDLYIDNFLAGQAIIYYIRGGLRGVGVVYYVVVDERFRRRGLGKILVSSAEQIFEDLNLDFSIATASIDNVVSHRMFKSLSYDEEDLERISRICSHQIQEMILKLSCGYEDDLYFIKILGGLLMRII
jgi:GNAT superfamily N-acetyltransferase